MSLIGSTNEAMDMAPSPFLLHSRDSMPMNLLTALDYCRFLYLATPAYKAVTKRVVGHFVTKLNFRGEIGSPKEREEFEQFFREDLNALNSIRQDGDEYHAYGNGFLRIHFPFVRTLVDNRGSLRLYTLSTFPESLVKFNLTNLTYEVPDPTRSDLSVDKRPKISLTFRDTPGKDFSRIRLRLLDPRYCKLRYSESSGRTQVQYGFTPEQKSRIKRGVLHEVNETPLAMLQAVRANQDFLFDEDAVHHIKSPTITGISNEGWGVPEIMTHYPTIHKIAVYDRIDEAVGADYLMPMRILAPKLQGMDSNRGNAIATEWTPAVQRMVREQRFDRTKIHGFPYPFEYQELGGQGKQLAPKDLKVFEINQLLDNVGYPAELFRGTLTLQQIPSAIRVFESSFSHLSDGLSSATRWAVKKISRYMYGEAYDVALMSSSIADDIERRSLIFNLFSANELPRRVAFEGLGLGDELGKLRIERAKEELQFQADTAQMQAEEQRKQQLGSLNDLLAAEQGGGQGGAGGPPGTASPQQTPTDTRAQAQQLAQQWRGIPEDGKRSQAMAQVRSTNPDLYAVAKDILEQMRSQDASQGRQQGNQMAQQNPQQVPQQQ